MYNGKSRHIRRKYNTIGQLLLMGVITIDDIKSKDNITDPLNKARIGRGDGWRNEIKAFEISFCGGKPNLVD